MPTPKTFRVEGTPRPQGSKSVTRTGRMYEASTQLKPWRSEITRVAKANTDPADPFTVVQLEAIFCFERPKSHYRTGKYSNLLKPSAPEHHTQKPDVDKLQRALLDGITNSGAWKDDSVVVRVVADKVWVDLYNNISPGVIVTITQIGETR